MALLNYSKHISFNQYINVIEITKTVLFRLKFSVYEVKCDHILHLHVVFIRW